MGGARLEFQKDNQERSVIVTRIVLGREKQPVAFVNQLSTLISPSANPHWPRTWYADPSTSSGMYTSVLRSRKLVVHANKPLSANKSDFLEFTKYA
jgi:hypothetical protein